MSTLSWIVFLHDLEVMQEEIASLGPSYDTFARDMQAQGLVQEALRLQEMFLKVKSRARWLSPGDRILNLNFFTP